jgi:apolipoprotein N-acyltransferase
LQFTVNPQTKKLQTKNHEPISMNFKIKITALITSFTLMALTGYLMYSRFQAQEFWGYWPILLWSSLWVFVVVATESRFSKNPKKWKLLGLSTATGVLLSLGFPPIPLTSLMFVAFVPLLIVEKEISNFREGTSKWEVFKYSYNAFIIWNILTTYWVTNTAFIAAFVAISVNSLFMTIPFVLFHQVGKKLNQKMKWAAFIAFWITFEYIHLRQELSWPWLTLGNSFAEFPSWVQWYSFTGVFGGTLWILLSNVLFYKVISLYYFNKIPISLKKLSNPLLFVIIPILVSLVIFYTYKEDGDQIEVVIVQPNYEPHYEKFSMPETVQFKQIMNLAYSGATKETDYLLYPETVFGSFKINDLGNNIVARDLKSFISIWPKSKLVTGVRAYKIYKKGEHHSKAVRTQISSATQDTTFWEAYNAAIQFENGVDSIQIYKKSILVPGAEFFPYRKFLWFFKPLVDQLGGTMAGYGTQEDRGVFTSKEGISVAPVICYESIFGEYMTGYIRNGAQAIFIMTNDGWWDDTAGHKQHLRFASLRAIETRRSIARAANTGISCFVNQRGDILQATKYGEANFINGKITLNNKRTFYSTWGDIIGRIAIFLSILLLLNAFVKGVMPEDRSHEKAERKTENG